VADRDWLERGDRGPIKGETVKIMWLTDPLLGKDLETNNETTAVTIQRRGKHASVIIELLLKTVLCNPLLGRCNSRTTMETGCFLCGTCR
jgi:hypothetical protein